MTRYRTAHEGVYFCPQGHSLQGVLWQSVSFYSLPGPRENVMPKSDQNATGVCGWPHNWKSSYAENYGRIPVPANP